MSNMRTTCSIATTRLALLAAAAVLAAAACLGALGTFSPCRAYADDDATLTLVVKDDAGTSAEKNIDGMELAAYQVATIGDDGAYHLVSTYSKAGAKAGVSDDFNLNMEVADAKALAATMADIALGKPATAGAATNKQGRAEFGALPYGVYLVVQTGANGTAQDYEEIDPFLINVPQFTAEGNVFDVVAYPKSELTPKDDSTPPGGRVPPGDDTPPEPVNPPDADTPPTPRVPTTPNTPGTPTTSRTPQTGDAIDWPAVAGVSALGLAAMALAVVAARKRRA